MVLPVWPLAGFGVLGGGFFFDQNIMDIWRCVAEEKNETWVPTSRKSKRGISIILASLPNWYCSRVRFGREAAGTASKQSKQASSTGTGSQQEGS